MERVQYTLPTHACLSIHNKFSATYTHVVVMNRNKGVSHCTLDPEPHVRELNNENDQAYTRFTIPVFADSDNMS